MYKSFRSNQLKQIGRVLTSSQPSPFSKSATVCSLEDEWKKLAEKKLKGQSVDSLNWHTAEVKNL